MPIKDLSDRLRIPRLGKIRLGIKAMNSKGVEYPKAVDYFVCDAPRFQAIYPGQPKAIDIAFPTDDPLDWASQFYRAYTRSRGLICRGDGESAARTVFVDDKKQTLAGGTSDLRKTERVDVLCPGRQCPYYQSKQCKEVMMLQFLLPRVEGLGVWQLDTGSINSILNVNSAVALIRGVVGKIALLPLTLRVVPQEVSPEGTKKTVHVLQLDIPVKLIDLKQHLLLPPAEDEMPELLYPTPEERVAATEAEQSPQQVSGVNIEEELEKAPPEHPPTGDKSQRDADFWENRIKGCDTLAEVKRVGQLINGALAQGKISPADQLKLQTIWKARKSVVMGLPEAAMMPL